MSEALLMPSKVEQSKDYPSPNGRKLAYAVRVRSAMGGQSLTKVMLGVAQFSEA